MRQPSFTDHLSNRQQKTRLAFINALLRLVVEHGLDKITVTDIANEANYGRWTFYQYFDSKEDAAWETFVYWMNQLDAHLVAAVKHLESPQREYQSWCIIFQAFHQQKNFIMRLDSVLASKWRVQSKEFLVQQFVGHLYDGNPDGWRSSGGRGAAVCRGDYGTARTLGAQS
jgi:AcrR family transcriptional regulator